MDEHSSALGDISQVQAGSASGHTKENGLPNTGFIQKEDREQPEVSEPAFDSLRRLSSTSSRPRQVCPGGA